MKPIDIQKEAAALRSKFYGVNRAEFARTYRIKGGPAMIYQHITGRRPISLDAAIAYATGFGCTLIEISPRLAEEAKKASLVVDTLASLPETLSGTGAWPFPIPYEHYKALPPVKKQQLAEKVVSFIEGALPLAHPHAASKKVANGG